MNRTSPLHVAMLLAASTIPSGGSAVHVERPRRTGSGLYTRPRKVKRSKLERRVARWSLR